jgi:hypothetical protein
LSVSGKTIKLLIMNIHAARAQENKNHVFINKISQKQDSSQSGEPAFQFVDNRSETTTQMKLQKMALNSSQANQAQQLQTIANSHNKNPIQKQGPEEEELLQGKFKTVQKQSLEEEELLQGKFKTVQKKGLEEEELLQGKFHTVQKQGVEEEELLQGKFEPIQKQENNTGIPDNLKSEIENLSGYSLDDVQVHYNSDKPAGLQAHAYAQGTDIHLAPGQEKHLPHEAWHIVQQKQGRVKPTMQLQNKVHVNDDKGLEKEADVMGGKALQFKLEKKNLSQVPKTISSSIQFVLKDQKDSALNASLTKQYHEEENEGDDCSPVSSSIDVHKAAIEHYKNAKALRRRAGKLHQDEDGGHLLAIETLNDKILRRKQLIADLSPKTTSAKPKTKTQEKKGKSNWFGHEPMGTGGQASWLPGNQTAWEPRKFGT